MFRLSFLLVLATIPAAFNQFITFKDGKFGVNFGGYHAEAGLGGLLTGDASHGGLSASAGTPFGQKAGAGLGGSVNNGQTRGGLFAGATAGGGLGASAALGGKVDESGGEGGIGSELHGGGFSTKNVQLSQLPPQQPHQSASIDQRSTFEDEPVLRYNKRKRVGYKNKVVESRFDAAPAPQNNFDYTKFFDFGFFSNAGASFAGAPDPRTQPSKTNENSYVFNIEKQLDPSTISLQKTIVPRTQLVQPKVAPQAKPVEQRAKDDDDDDFDWSDEEVESDEIAKKQPSKNRRSSYGSQGTVTATKQIQTNPSFFNDIFNIPIATLGAVNQFLNNAGAGRGGVSVTKTKTVGGVH